MIRIEFIVSVFMLTVFFFFRTFCAQDETLGERLWALTEMFPESVRKGTSTLVSTTGKVIVGM